MNDILDDKIQEEYPVTDLDFAAVLYHSGKRIIGARPDPRDDRRKVFIFEADPDIDGLKHLFINGQLRLEPLGLFDAARFLKNLIHRSI